MDDKTAKSEESESEEKKESDFDQEKEQAQVWTGKITAFFAHQFRTSAPPLPIIGGSITGIVTWVSQHDTVKAIIVGGVTFIVTGFFTYGSAWSQAFLEVARTKGKDHGKGTALSFFVWLDKGLEKIRWQLANPDGKYLIKLRDSDCRYDDVEGIEDAIFGFSTPELEEIFINLDLSQLELRSEEESKGTGDDIWNLLRLAKKRTNLRLLILAPGGRGKTTLLRHLAYNYALKQPKQNAPFLIPVFLRLRRWQEVITTTEGLDLPTLIERHLKQDISQELDLPQNWAKNHLTHQRMLVMFDGFDEVKPEYTDKVSQWIGKQWQDFRQNYFILTSRPKGYQAFSSEHKPRQRVFINEFTDKNIADFVYKWYFWQEQETRVSRSLKAKQEAADNKAKDLINQLFALDDSGESSTLLALARNPLNLNMIVQLHRANFGSGQKLPQQRVDLFRRIFDLQLITRPQARGIDMILDNNEENHRQRALQQLALKMGNTTTIEYSELLSSIQNFIQELGYTESTSAKDFVERLIHVSELILKKDEYYEFAHNLFQSYLIALEVKRLKQENLLWENWGQNLWYDACIMYATLLINPTGFIVHFYNQDNPKAQGLAERCYRELPVKKRRGLEFLEQKRQTSLFTQLETYLKNGQWREADEETAQLMLLIVGKETDEVLYEDEINTLPCDELLTIDQLWKKYSNGHFGFSIQLQIMSKYGELPERYDWDNYVIFAEELGWHQKDGTKRGKWLNYDEISFNLDSPMGHLPLAKSVFLEGYAVGRWHLFSRIKNCNL
ncbi:MAG: NACHT domain-containing protein [Microcystis aeruginosa Ma_QC_Ca_00000000_S207]|uniref:NACHT domain-containing protein n=1 Tax=Microcystis aeruginosa Ma_QC_Ca_00000000_S207 TaxID=2486251 RepID=A0A552FNC5_MICAE|nr:MAG: NACHT domain-containing protein [Microcystis aeruginosa Ma_QC_Ca_00000000_S207]